VKHIIFLFVIVLFLATSSYALDEVKICPAEHHAGDMFGTAVAVDGDYMVVGAIGYDVGEDQNVGSAYVFHWDGDEWIEQTRIQLDDRSGSDNFGAAVDIAGDYIIVGAPNEDPGGEDNAGSAWIYMRNGQNWDFQAQIVSRNPFPNENFGAAVVINGNMAVVGSAGSDTSCVYARDGANWDHTYRTLSQQVGAGYGDFISMHGNSYVISGYNLSVSGQAGAGQAFVNIFDGQNLALQGIINSSTPTTNGHFGWDCSIFGDILLVGASGDSIVDVYQGAAYIFERNAGNWSRTDKLFSDVEPGDGYGKGVAINNDYAVIGAPDNDAQEIANSGIVFLFESDEGNWNELGSIVPDDAHENMHFGQNLALSDTLIFSGCPDATVEGSAGAGAVYMFVVNSPPAVTVIDPNGGEVLVENTEFEIEWEVESMQDIVQNTIEYSADNGQNWSQIGTTDDDDYDFEWTIPDTFSTSCLIRVTAETDDQEGSDVSNATFTIVTIPDVVVSVPDGGEQYQTDEEVTIEWDVTNEPDIIENVVEYSTDGGDTWINIGATQDEDFDIVWIIPDIYSLYTVVRVRSTNEYDVEGYDISDDWFIIVPTSASYTFYRGWTFFSLPYTPDDNSVETLIEAGIIDHMPWDLFGFDMSTAYYRPEELFVGNGYMLTMYQDSLEMSFDCEAGIEQVDWELDLGWNLIGVPFGQPLTVENQTLNHEGELYTIANAADSLLCVPIFYDWSAQDSAYLIADVLDVWKSYYFVALDTMVLNLFPAPPGPVPTAIDDVPGTIEAWQLNIIAEMDGKRDPLAAIGANAYATDGFNPAFDYPEPPNGNISQVVNTYFEEEEWIPNFATTFCRDIREQMVEEEDVWTMFVSTIRPGDVTLTWDDIFDTTPAGYEFEINDPAADVTINPKAEASYTFYNEGTSEIVIRAFASLNVKNRVEIPSTHNLLTAYPNPFNSTLSITMDLQSSSNVTLSVFDLNGKLVDTVLNGSMEAGTNELKWDAKGITNGVYIIRLQTRTQEATQKVLLMK